MAITQKDVARELNVSASLVGKVLGGKPNVWASPELRERIHVKARELGYRPNAAAQALARGETRLIGLWATRLDLYGYSAYVRYLQELAHRDGYQVLVRQVEYAPVEWDWPADGIICVDSRSRIGEYRAAGGTAPVVSVGVLSGDGADEVVTDLHAGAQEAMTALLEAGRGRIAYLLPEMALGVLDDGRRMAYDAAMGDRTEFVVARDLEAGAAYDAMAAHLREHGAPDGLLVFAVEMAVGAMRALADGGYRVPDDVAVVASGDSPMLQFHSPSISAIDLPIRDAAAVAWRLLGERRVNPDGMLQRVLLPTRLVRRESLG